ncbi:methyl-accepting chemotaxis protein [Desulfovibrio sp. OttesenSCG-928-C14]|nr:methyl-accepting chemotaxis protein [Desulfovibrio sp. OttesenSCG-928-C14]
MQEMRGRSLILASELQQSSEDLTSLVRQFAVTGDENFARAYQDVVDVRAGKKSRPREREIAPGRTVSLTDLMREAGFTDSEFRLLQQSGDLSNNLIILETEAMNAVRGLFPDDRGNFSRKGAPDKNRAMELVFSQAYTGEVSKIMAPLSKFTSELNQRLNRAVDEAQSAYNGAMFLLCAAGGAVLLMFAVFLMLVYILIVRPILKCDEFAKAVSDGNLDMELQLKSKNEIGMLAGSLRSIPATLKQIISEYRRLEQELVQGNLAIQGEAARFNGEYANLVAGTNAMLARYQLIFDTLATPMGMFDKDQRLVYMNRFARRMAGEDFKGKTCRQIMAREDDGTQDCAMQRAAGSLQPATAETVGHPGGARMDISYTVVPFVDENGRLSSLLQLVTDLTQIKSTQRTILEVAEQALDVSNRVATAAEQLSAQIAEVNKGTEVQRERVSSTATAMEQMNATVMEVAGNASDARVQAESTKEKASEGAALVNKVSHAIQEVHAVASELEANMQKLGQQAESIGSVMNVISDIADQTNLLALNAAIEAARAGEAGRGFAVVADEVRKLAEKTMNATSEVGANITAIQASTQANIQRVGEAALAVNQATELATVSGGALTEILDLVNANTSLISSIATAAEEQSATSEAVNEAVEDINRIAEDTAGGMQQSAEAVRELSEMAQELREQLERLSA